MIVNGAACGQDACNAVRLSASMAKRDEVTLRVFLMGDGVTVAMAGQKTPDGYYKLDRMLSVVPRHGGQVGCCGTRMDARDITEAMITEGCQAVHDRRAHRWTLAATTSTANYRRRASGQRPSALAGFAPLPPILIRS